MKCRGCTFCKVYAKKPVRVTDKMIVIPFFVDDEMSNIDMMLLARFTSYHMYKQSKWLCY